MTQKPQKISVGVMGIPLNKQGQFLITLRHEPDKQTHNKWQVTGGTMEFGETPQQTLSREIKEELGVTSRILHPLPIAKTWVWHHPNLHHHVLLLCYVIDIGNQDIHLDNNENSEFKWINNHDIGNLDFLPLADDFINEAHQLVIKHNLISKLT